MGKKNRPSDMSKPVSGPSGLAQPRQQIEVGEVPKSVLATNARIETTLQFQGPIPPPDLLAQYNKIEPGLASRVVAMAENEANHRHICESEVIRKEYGARRLGQVFAFLLALVGLSISGLLLYCGRTLGGSVLGGGVLVALVTAFLAGKSGQSAEK